MRTPTSPQERWAWWEAAIAGEDPPIHEDEPHAGFYAVRRFRYGEWVGVPMVPARIWLESPTDPETGELIADERYRAEIDGKPVDPLRKWTWMARRPISQEEWEWLRALSPLAPKRIPKRRP